MAASSLSGAKSQVIILTGPVGTGKSSLMNSILELRPSEEPDWTVIVNDTGRTEVVAKGGAEPASNMRIHTVYGACEMSAETGVPMRTVALRALLPRPPRRIFIELSTLAQPTALRALLDNANAVASTQVVALVPLVQHIDLWRLSVAYQSQLKQADVLALRLSDSDLKTNKQEEALTAIKQNLADKQIILWGFENSGEYETSAKGQAANYSKVYSLKQVARILLAA